MSAYVHIKIFLCYYTFLLIRPFHCVQLTCSIINRVLFFAQLYVTVDLEIIETAKPSPISHCLTGNVVFDHRVTGHFSPFLIAHNTGV